LSVMQAVMSCQELIDRPGAEGHLLRLVHLQMKFVPRPVMKKHNGHEDGCPLPGYQCNERSKWNSLERRLAHSQPYLLVFTSSDRFIAEYLGVQAVISNRKASDLFAGKWLRALATTEIDRYVFSGDLVSELFHSSPLAGRCEDPTATTRVISAVATYLRQAGPGAH